jgi:hypothetical protein
MSKRTLSQVITVNKSVHSRAYEQISELHKKAQKPDLFAGIVKTYEASNDAEEQLPPESKPVQLRWEEILNSYKKLWTEWWDLEASKDEANTRAKADITVDGVVLASDVPVSHLLFLEKQLADVRKAIDVLPELPSDKEWTFDPSSNIHKTEVRRKARVQNKKRPVVLHGPVFKDGHPPLPAQTQLVDDQVITGYYSEMHLSGAVTQAKKQGMLERVNRLIDAVKDARQRANQTEAADKAVGKKLLDFVMG